jgi:hypothetical protein
MRALIPAFLMAAALTGGAAAQSTVVLHPLTGEDDVIVRDYVTRVAPPAVEFHQTLRPGSIVPEGVPLQIFGSDAPKDLSGYAYFVSVDNKVVVVEADTRRVVRILSGKG